VRLARFPSRSAPAHPASPLLLALAAAAACASLAAAPGPAGALGAILAALALAIAATDWNALVIPNALNAAVAGCGLLDVAIEHRADLGAAASDAASRAAAVAALLYGFAALYRRLRGRPGLGLGDVKLAAAGAIWLDWPALSAAIELAALSGIALALAQRLRTGRKLDRFAKLPFGALLAPSIWLCWLATRISF
jgi:leader peptidase (prepilin peptidase) / N-methyltransferase